MFDLTKTLPIIALGTIVCGCHTAVVSPPIAGVTESKPILIENGGMATYEGVKSAVDGLKDNNVTAQNIADVLMAVESVQMSDKDQNKVNEIVDNLLPRLREKVKNEVSSLHERALKSSSYREGYELARQAGAVLALYPLSDATATIKEAEDLSLRQNEVVRRLEMIRRQRYNNWAAEQAEAALRVLRQNGKNGTEAALFYLRDIEPSLLEASVASLYSYTVNEIMGKYKIDEKAHVAKELTNPHIMRRGLEDL